MVPVVTPIPILTLEGAIGVYPGGISIGNRDVVDSIDKAVRRLPEREHCAGGDPLDPICGEYRLVLSVVPS